MEIWRIVELVYYVGGVVFCPLLGLLIVYIWMTSRARTPRLFVVEATGDMVQAIVVEEKKPGPFSRDPFQLIVGTVLLLLPFLILGHP